VAQRAPIPPARPATLGGGGGARPQAGPYGPPPGLSPEALAMIQPGRGQMWGPQGGYLPAGGGAVAPASAFARDFAPSRAQQQQAPPQAYNTNLWRMLLSGGAPGGRGATPRLLGMNQGGGRG
jgi:hypothetical protein